MSNNALMEKQEMAQKEEDIVYALPFLKQTEEGPENYKALGIDYVFDNSNTREYQKIFRIL